MFKKLSIILVLFVLIFNVLPVSAASDIMDDHRNNMVSTYKSMDTDSKNAIVFESTITVTEDGGTFNVGFVKIVFPKDFLDSESLPATFDVKINSVDGVAGIEFSPDTPEFNQDVIIKANKYSGLLYDETIEKNLFFKIKSQVLKVKHFSRYAFS